LERADAPPRRTSLITVVLWVIALMRSLASPHSLVPLPNEFGILRRQLVLSSTQFSIPSRSLSASTIGMGEAMARLKSQVSETELQDNDDSLSSVPADETGEMAMRWQHPGNDRPCLYDTRAQISPPRLPQPSGNRSQKVMPRGWNGISDERQPGHLRVPPPRHHLGTSAARYLRTGELQLYITTRNWSKVSARGSLNDGCRAKFYGTPVFDRCSPAIVTDHDVPPRQVTVILKLKEVDPANYLAIADVTNIPNRTHGSYPRQSVFLA
jgi:hypothetical protein